MALQFPANPSNGQSFTASNNIVYVYDGEKWITQGSAQAQGGYVLKTGDVMTGQLTLPGGGLAADAIQKQEVESLISAIPTPSTYWDRTSTTLKPANVGDSVEIGGSTTIGAAWGNDQSVLVTGAQYLARQDSGGQVFGAYSGGSDASNNTVSITGSGTATFAGNVTIGDYNGFTGNLIYSDGGYVSRRTNDDQQLYVGLDGGTVVFSVARDGTAAFAGTITSANVTFNLATGGTLDVKERLQNTQAILLRLKACLLYTSPSPRDGLLSRMPSSA